MDFWKYFSSTTFLSKIKHKSKEIELGRANINFIVVQHFLPTTTLFRLLIEWEFHYFWSFNQVSNALHLDFDSNGLLHNLFKSLPTWNFQHSLNHSKKNWKPLNLAHLMLKYKERLGWMTKCTKWYASEELMYQMKEMRALNEE